MICWYCHWGWSKEVADIYDRYVETAGESAMHYGPAHIVWEDENFERHHVQWCLDHFDDYRGDHTDKELTAVKQSLLDLLQLSDDVLNPEPSDYDGKHPENYPPQVEMRLNNE